MSRAVYVPRYRVSLVRESSAKVEARYARRPSEAASVLWSCMPEDVDREVFAVLLLDVRRRAVGFHVVSVGCLNSSLVHPREVFKAAILGNAASVVLCHNHPSGDPEPSPDDVALTLQLVAAGGLLGIAVVDHIILGDSLARHVSLHERGVV